MKKYGLILLIVCSNSFASNWVVVSTGPTLEVSVDAASIVPVKNMRKAWVTYDRATPLTIGYPPKSYLSSVQLEYFNCSERTGATIQSSAFTGNTRGGESIYSQTTRPEAARFEEVIPDSVGATTLDFVCDAKLRPR